MTIITTLRLLMGKENNRQEQKSNVSRWVETLKKESKHCDKNNVLDGLIHTGEKRMSLKTCQ